MKTDNARDLAFTLMYTTITKIGTFDVTLELFVALDLTFSLTTTTLLTHHLTALSPNKTIHVTFTSTADIIN